MQTIENFFDFAFLIKDKAAAEDTIGDFGLPFAVATNELATDQRQHVVSLGMKDLEKVAELIKEINKLEKKSTAENVLIFV